MPATSPQTASTSSLALAFSVTTRLSSVAESRRSDRYTFYASSLYLRNAISEQSAIWKGPRGYGRRHCLDFAPFTLWDSEKGDFRHPSAWEWHRLLKTFQSQSIQVCWPLIIVETDLPPSPLPLTIGGVAVRFEPVRPLVWAEIGQGWIPEPREEPRFTKHTVNYIDLRGYADPLDFKFAKWVRPSRDQLQSLIKALSEFCNPQWVHIMWPCIIIELYCNDDRVYEPSSLPSKLGGYNAVYHHQQESVFEEMSARARQTSSSSTMQDTTNYLEKFSTLYPGVRVTSATDVDGDAHPDSRSSTTGVLLQDSHGKRRLTLSNYSFIDRNEISHPCGNNQPIGEIDERWEAQDIALVKLHSNVGFDNRSYFEAKAPRKLLRSTQIAFGEFVCMDGMSSGLVFMQIHGCSLRLPSQPTGKADIDFVEYNICHIKGGLDDAARTGARGAAVVEDDNDEGGVIGLFVPSGPDFALVPCLDELIDRSWTVV